MKLTAYIFALPAIASAKLLQDVTQSAFEQLIKDNELVFTAFTSKSLESLQPFHATFEQASKDSYTPYVIVNCDEETELCAQYDVNAYPALRLFKKATSSDDPEGEVEEAPEVIRYRGKRTKNAIDSFVTKYELPALSHIEPRELKDFKKIDNVVVIAYLRDDQESLLKVLQTVAEKHQYEFVFGYVTDTASADAEGLAMPAVVCYKNLDGDNKIMQGHFKAPDIETLLDGVTDLTIGEFSERNIEAYMTKGKLTAYLFASTEESGTALRRELTPLAKKYAQYVNFVVADAVEYAPMAKNYGLTEDVYPALVVHAPMNDNIFRYQQGKVIEGIRVEAMLTTILQAKAVNGQVFGDEAPRLEDAESDASESEKTHDEL